MEALYNIYTYEHSKSLDRQLKLDTGILFQDNYPENFDYQGLVPYYTFHNLNEMKKTIIGLDEDFIITVIGRAGEGKTTLSILCSIMLDKNFNSQSIIFDVSELLTFFKKCADEIKKERSIPGYQSTLRGSSIIIDEGVYLLFSADSNTKIGKLVTKLFTVIRFLNLVVFINVTNYEKLNKTIRDSRISGALRIDHKGTLSFFSKKRARQIQVTETLDVEYPEPNFTEPYGFISKDCQFWKDYNHRKSKFVSDAITEILQEVEK